jgi:hypothetical protein
MRIPVTGKPTRISQNLSLIVIVFRGVIYSFFEIILFFAHA